MRARWGWWLAPAAALFGAGCLQVLGLGDYRDGTGAAAGAGGLTTASSSTGAGGGGSGGATSCTPNQSSPCYDGPAGTDKNGICHAGMHVCQPDGMSFGSCLGEQKPLPENCSTPDDEDCNGFGCGQTVWAHGYPTNVFGINPTHVATSPDGSIYASFTFSQAFTMGGTNLIPTGTTSGGLARFTPTGDVVWAKLIGPEVSSLAANAMGPVVHAGAQLVRLDPNGTQQWTATCGTDWRGIVSFDGQGNVLDVANVGDMAHDCGSGAIPPVNSGYGKILLSKFSPSGAAQWGVLLKSTMDVAAFDFKADSAGNLLFAGWCEGTLNWGALAEVCKGRDAFVAKYSPSGTHVWSSIFGDAGYQEAHAIAVDALGNPVIGGYFGGTIDFGGSPMTATGTNQFGFIAKLGNFGVYQWAHAYAGANQDIDAISIDGAGASFVVGTTTGPTDLGGGPVSVASGSQAGFLLKLDPTGAFTWGRLVSPGGSGAQLGITVDSAGFPVLGGSYSGATFDPGGGALPAPGPSEFNTFLARVAP